MADTQEYDVIIIGGGPAGLSAAIYTSRDKHRTLLLEKEMVGGQVANVEWIENYPGFPEGVNGFELGQLMQKQAEKYGLEVRMAEATGIETKDGLHTVKTPEGDFSAKVVIIAGAAVRQKLGVPGEDEYAGKGVSYCATCDGPMFPDEVIAVAGGGDAAVTEALHLSKFGSKVYLIHRRDQLRAGALLTERALAEPKIEILWDTIIEKLEGEQFLTTLHLKNAKTGEQSTLPVAAVFVSIGLKPATEFLKGIVTLDQSGHVIANQKMETDVPGIYAAGDIRSGSARQVSTAVGDGATAAIYAGKYLTE